MTNSSYKPKVSNTRPKKPLYLAHWTTDMTGGSGMLQNLESSGPSIHGNQVAEGQSVSSCFTHLHCHPSAGPCCMPCGRVKTGCCCGMGHHHVLQVTARAATNAVHSRLEPECYCCCPYLILLMPLTRFGLQGALWSESGLGHKESLTLLL